MVWRKGTPHEMVEAWQEYGAADKELAKVRLSRASTPSDILAARLRFDAATRNAHEAIRTHLRANPSKKKSKDKRKQKLWTKVKKGSKTKTGHGAIGAGAGALLLGPIGAIAGAYIGSKSHKDKKKRKKNPEPMITLTDSYARMLAECCGSPEETEEFTAIDLLAYQVLVEKQPVALSLIMDAYNDLKRLKKLQTDPVTRELIEGFEESLEFQIKKAQNPRAFKLATEVARGRRSKTERGASSIASAEKGARSARKSSVGRTLRSLNPGWHDPSAYSAYEGKLERMSDSAVEAEHRKLEKMFALADDPDREFGVIGILMLKRMIEISADEVKKRSHSKNPKKKPKAKASSKIKWKEKAALWSGNKGTIRKYYQSQKISIGRVKYVLTIMKVGRGWQIAGGRDGAAENDYAYTLPHPLKKAKADAQKIVDAGVYQKGRARGSLLYPEELFDPKDVFRVPKGVKKNPSRRSPDELMIGFADDLRASHGKSKPPPSRFDAPNLKQPRSKIPYEDISPELEDLQRAILHDYGPEALVEARRELLHEGYIKNRSPTYKDIQKLLKAQGFEPIRQRGSHEIYRSRTGKTVSVPRKKGSKGMSPHYEKQIMAAANPSGKKKKFTWTKKKITPGGIASGPIAYITPRITRAVPFKWLVVSHRKRWRTYLIDGDTGDILGEQRPSSTTVAGAKAKAVDIKATKMPKGTKYKKERKKNPPALEILAQFDKKTPGPNQLSYLQARMLGRLFSLPQIGTMKAVWSELAESYMTIILSLKDRGLIEIGPTSGPHPPTDSSKGESTYSADWVRLSPEGLKFAKENRINEAVEMMDAPTLQESLRVKDRVTAVDLISRPKKSRMPNPAHPYLKKCREGWEGCCKSVTPAKLKACFKRFEKGIEHADLEVRKECRQGMRACKAAMKEHGVKVNPSPKKKAKRKPLPKKLPSGTKITRVPPGRAEGAELPHEHARISGEPLLTARAITRMGVGAGKFSPNPRKKNAGYQDAMMMDVTKAEAIREIMKHRDAHGMSRAQAMKSFFEACGEKDEYEGEEVLAWLGY